MNIPKNGLVKFSATWCSPCHVLSEIMSEVISETGVVVTDVDIEEESGTAAQYGVKTLPTVVLCVDGEVVDVTVGLHTKDEYVRLALLATSSNQD